MRARASAAVGERLAARVIDEEIGDRAAERGRFDEHAGHAGDDAAAVAADVGRHRRRAARCRFGEAQPPPLGERPADDEPRAPVVRDEVLAVDPARRSVIHSAGPGGRDRRFELGAQRAVADDRRA